MRCFARKRWWKKIRDKGGDYLITVKENQKQLLRDMDAEFALETLTEANGIKVIDNEVKEHTPLDNAHGRLEERRIRVMPVPKHHRKTYASWKDMAQWCQMKRTVQKQKHKTVEYAYAITSLTPDKTTPEQLLTYNRNHWRVESFHWVKDTLLKEDASTVRKGNAPQTLAILRNTKLHLIKKMGLSPKKGHELLFNNTKLITKIT